MSFPTVGMYGLPVGPEALQQSQQAYAEFRKQMLASSQMTRGRRVSKGQGDDGLSFSRISPLDMDNDHEPPSPEDCPENGKPRLGKSEQQVSSSTFTCYNKFSIQLVPAQY